MLLDTYTSTISTIYLLYTFSFQVLIIKFCILSPPCAAYLGRGAEGGCGGQNDFCMTEYLVQVPGVSVRPLGYVYTSSIG